MKSLCWLSPVLLKIKQCTLSCSFGWWANLHVSAMVGQAGAFYRSQEIRGISLRWKAWWTICQWMLMAAAPEMRSKVVGLILQPLNLGCSPKSPLTTAWQCSQCTHFSGYRVTGCSSWPLSLSCQNLLKLRLTVILPSLRTESHRGGCSAYGTGEIQRSLYQKNTGFQSNHTHLCVAAVHGDLVLTLLFKFVAVTLRLSCQYMTHLCSSCSWVTWAY